MVTGFTSGFRIPISHPVSHKVCRNHPSALANKEVVSQKLASELSAGRILGPFAQRPSNLVCSPLALIPKREPNQFRLIHDLSYPKNQSVNSAIEKYHTHVVYDSIDIVVEKVKLNGRNCLMAKTDIENAFRLLPIHSQDRHLLGFTWHSEGGSVQYYMDACLAMGLSISCQVFERFSSALQWILESKYDASMSHIIDDFFFVGPANSDKCRFSLHTFLDICRDIQIPIKQEKTTVPATCITIYGIEVDSLTMETRLPTDKIVKISNALQDIKNRKKVTLRELQSVIGLLNFATSCVVPGRTFLRRLYDLTAGVKWPWFSIRISMEARADLAMWNTFINSFNGRCMFLGDDWVSSDTLHLVTDAALSVGFAAVFGSQWFAKRWPVSFLSHHINVLELFPIVLAVEIWGGKMSNHKIVFHSDNEATVHVLNNMSSKDKVMMQLIRRLVLHCMRHNILFRAKHLPGHLNTIADRLSRFKFQEAFQCAPHLSNIPITLEENQIQI